MKQKERRKMTIKEFSNKYHVPYPIVYNASCHVNRKGTMERDNDLMEADLLKAVIVSLKGKRSRAMMEAEGWNDMIVEVNSIAKGN